MDNKPLTIEEIHEGTLVILKKIIEICDNIKVNYFIAYGTLIGAVRHKGFIPWDDDFDIIMLRPEYDKFVSYCDAHAKELFPFRLMNRFNTPGYPFNISRFNDMRFRMESNGYPDAGMGMFIDIYPFDGCGNKVNNKYKLIRLFRRFYVTMLFLTLNERFNPSKKGYLRNILKFLMYSIVKRCDSNFFLARLEQLRYNFDYNDSKLIGLLVWDTIAQPIDKKYYQDYIFLEFNGIKVKAPKDYDFILKSIYGDYLQLPPLEQRRPHHEYKLYRK